jgi:hypothetical protein
MASRKNRPGAEKAAILLAFGPLYKRGPGNPYIHGLQAAAVWPAWCCCAVICHRSETEAARKKRESVDANVAFLPPMHVPLENRVTNSDLIIASYVELGVNRAWVIGEQKTYVLQR